MVFVCRLVRSNFTSEIEYQNIVTPTIVSAKTPIKKFSVSLNKVLKTSNYLISMIKFYNSALKKHH